MKRSKLVVFLRIAAIIAAILLVINLIPPKENVSQNPFLVEKGQLPLIAAHRGGGINNPENTMLAFREAVNTIGVDILECDLHLTRDGHLVFNHNNYIDETCNVNGDLTLAEVKALCEDPGKRHYIQSMTLEELRQYNFGYYFEDANGQRIYQDVTDPAALGLQIVTAEELFAEFYTTHPDLLFCIEIKGSQDLGKSGCKALLNILEQFPDYRDRIVISTFHNEVEDELRSSNPSLLRGASTFSAAVFVATSFLGLNILDDGDFACLQIPAFYYTPVIRLSLASRLLVFQAHRRNVAVQYWTINDADEMRELIELGCDCIMTDDPALLKQVMDEYR